MDDQHPGARPRLRIAPLVFGVVFILIGMTGLGGDVNADRSWIWVGLLTGAGIAGLVASAQSIRTR